MYRQLFSALHAEGFQVLRAPGLQEEVGYLKGGRFPERVSAVDLQTVRNKLHRNRQGSVFREYSLEFVECKGTKRGHLKILMRKRFPLFWTYSNEQYSVMGNRKGVFKNLEVQLANDPNWSNDFFAQQFYVCISIEL